MNTRPLLSLAGLGLLLLALTVWALMSGSEPVRLSDLAGGLIPGAVSGHVGTLILAELRGPRVVLALVVGAMLAMAGQCMQDMTRNALADPSLLGVRGGAALAVVGLMLAFPGAALSLRVAAGLAGGLGAGLGLMAIGGRGSGRNFVIMGLGLSWFLSAALILALAAADESRLQAALIWLAGDLQAARWSAVASCGAVALAGLLLLLALAPSVAVARLGVPVAASLGLDGRRLARLQLVAAIALVSVATACVGGIGFVGLVAPHLGRRLPDLGGRGRVLATAGCGAALVLLSDTLGRTLFAPVELPVGIGLAALGAPMLLVLLFRRERR